MGGSTVFHAAPLALLFGLKLWWHSLMAVTARGRQRAVADPVQGTGGMCPPFFKLDNQYSIATCSWKWITNLRVVDSLASHNPWCGWGSLVMPPFHIFLDLPLTGVQRTNFFQNFQLDFKVSKWFHDNYYHRFQGIHVKSFIHGWLHRSTAERAWEGDYRLQIVLVFIASNPGLYSRGLNSRDYHRGSEKGYGVIHIYAN